MDIILYFWEQKIEAQRNLLKVTSELNTHDYQLQISSLWKKFTMFLEQITKIAYHLAVLQ